MENKFLNFKKIIDLGTIGNKTYNKFYLSANGFSSVNHGIHISGSTFSDTLFELDDEDVDFLKKKYLPKIEDEYQDELNKLKEKYNK